MVHPIFKPLSEMLGVFFAKKLTLPEVTCDKFQLKVTLTSGKKC